MENWGNTHIRSFYTRNLFNYVPPVFARRIHVCNFFEDSAALKIALVISLEMPVPSQGHYGFHSFLVVD